MDIDIKYNAILKRYHIYLARLSSGVTVLSCNPNVITGDYSLVGKYNSAGQARAIVGLNGTMSDILYVADGENGLLKLKRDSNGFAILKHIKPGGSRDFNALTYEDNLINILDGNYGVRIYNKNLNEIVRYYLPNATSLWLKKWMMI